MLRCPLRQSGCRTKGCAYSSRGARWEGKKKRALVPPPTPQLQPVMGMLRSPTGLHKPGFVHLPRLPAVRLLPAHLAPASWYCSLVGHSTSKPLAPSPPFTLQGFVHFLGLLAVRLLSAHLTPASWYCSLVGHIASKPGEDASRLAPSDTVWTGCLAVHTSTLMGCLEREGRRTQKGADSKNPCSSGARKRQALQGPYKDLYKEVEGLLRGLRPYSDGLVKGSAVTHDQYLQQATDSPWRWRKP